MSRYIKNLIDDMRSAIRVGWRHWRYTRCHLRVGGCPDEHPAEMF